MSTTDKYLTYRGDLKAIVGIGGTLAFVTLHAEGQATGLYRLDADKLTVVLDPLPRGGAAVVADGETLWIAGTDTQVYECSINGGKPKTRGAPFPTAPTALALLSDTRLAVLAGSEIAILARKDGKVLQTLGLPEPGTCLAADPSGRWLAAGTANGTVAVFEAEDKPEYLSSSAAPLHEGAVTALLFEPDDLRFLSAGADLKLLTTHARGRLEPEDKGRGNNHTDIITSLIWGPGDRLYSGSRDGALKSWPRAGNVRPATIKDGVGRVVALSLVEVLERPRLVAACDDNTLRFFPIDVAGKIGELSHRVYDNYARAAAELAQNDPKRREAALQELADFGDARAVELISAQVGADADHVLRRLAVQMLGDSAHPRAATLLEQWLNHPDEAVRVSAFDGLRKHLGADDLRPLDLALKVDQANVGQRAVKALESLAGRDDQALARLLATLNAKTPAVRQSALVSLEVVYDAKTPEADLVGLTSKHADVRRLALVRLFQRQMLGAPAVPSALRRRAEDDDPDVRRTAFLLSLYTRDRLIKTLRPRDPELQRQLSELEGGTPEKPEKEKKAKPALEDADYEPLLQATASRALDTCLRGARGLALLGDPRAFGLLLQLSREEDKTARVEVCRALGALDDPRAVERLRSLLHDKEAEVRDAAFTALARIHQANPLLAAESGLNASAEDVRKRGLQVLIAEVRKKSAEGLAGPLLVRALNDSFESIRTEAFKAALNLQLAGGGAGTLRFVLRSIHADVRREVLTETMAQIGEPWGWDLLLEFFNDPDPKLRADAFAFAVKKTKGLEFLEAALGSRYADVRKQSVDGLIKKHTAAAQALLVRALGDEEREVRLATLEALVAADALPALSEALENPFADVRLRAAKALAQHGDSKAFSPLVPLATAPEPSEPDHQKVWRELVESALDGLGVLGDSTALPHLIPLLDSKHPTIRKQAARALLWVARPDTLGALRQALPHHDPEVKYAAALGLAYAGDASVASLVFSNEAVKVLSVGERLAAALTLGPPGEDRLVLFLDHETEEARNRALLLLLMREWKAPDGSASRLLACLAARLPRMRLIAARGLEVLADPAAFASYVTELVNDRGEKPAWKVPETTVDALAEFLVHGRPLVQARTARLLRHLSAEDQAAWDQAWDVHQARFASESASLKEQARKRKALPLRYGAAELRDLAFGAYVGLVREQGGSRGGGKGPGTIPDAQIIRVRQTALGRLLALARFDPRLAVPSRPVFMQALGDPNQVVRLQAFDHLQSLGMDPAALAAESLESGHTDLGVKGLELLTGGASDARGQAVLEQTMLTRADELATEAAKLLIARRGVGAVADRALEAAHEPLRKQAVAWLAAESDKDATARDRLRQALGSRYREVREAVALELAARKDPSAFDALVKLLLGANLPVPQRRFIQALVTLGNPRAPDVFLDRLENDPGGTALADDLLRAAGNFRRPETAGRLLALLEKDRKWRESVFSAVQTISGFDQSIDDPDEERPDRRWEEKQFPRSVAVLARLMDRLAALNDAKLMLRLVPAARWARGPEVEPVLAGLVNHPDEALRRAVVEALGWRLRKRGTSPDALRKALGHRDPVTQFFAAEGLAQAGRPEGLNVLLASIDFVTDLALRRRAVLALGELADERALDALLRLAAEDGHALQEAAAEAIGHLGKSEKAEEIFQLLERHARREDSVAETALTGLRWLDSHAAWQLVRGRAADPSFLYRETAVTLLGRNDDPATRDLLLKLLATDGDSEVVALALESARRVFGDGSLEPDYAAIQSAFSSLKYDLSDAFERVSVHGDPGRLFAVLPKTAGAVQDALTTILLNRPTLPVAEARAALYSPDGRTVGLAARVLGRAGAAAGPAEPALPAALHHWRDAWETLRRTQRPEDVGAFDDPLDQTLTPCLRSLVWAAGRLGVARADLIALAVARTDDPKFRPIRLEVVNALAASEWSPEVVAALEAAAVGDDPEVRALAADAIGRRAPDRVPALAERLLSDRVSFHRLASGQAARLGAVLRPAARLVHSQGVVLPFLIDQGDVEGLAAIAEDRTLPEVARLGSIEGLAATARTPAEDVLRRIGRNEAEDEELRKAAWRGLRRSRRARDKAKLKVEVKP